MPPYAWEDSESALFKCPMLANTHTEAHRDDGSLTYQTLGAYFHFPTEERALIFFWFGLVDEIGQEIDMVSDQGFDWNSIYEPYSNWMKLQSGG
jgi:hypothetical protein